MKNFNMTKIVIMVVVFFSTFIFFSCGGEEQNLPDDESKNDTEITDEITDENVDETEDEIIDEETFDEDIYFEEIRSEEECLASDCKELCLLKWQDNTEIQWCPIDLEDDNKIFCTEYQIKYSLFQTDNKKCFFIKEDSNIKIESKKLPIEAIISEEDGWRLYYSLTKEKDIIFEYTYFNCINENINENVCEEGEEKIVGQKNGEDVFIWTEDILSSVKLQE